MPIEQVSLRGLISGEYSIVFSENPYGSKVATGRCQRRLPVSRLVNRHTNIVGMEFDCKTRLAAAIPRTENLEIIEKKTGRNHQPNSLPSTEYAGFRWAPDSRHLAFLCENRKTCALWVHDLEHKQSRCLLHAMSAPVGKILCWAADGQSLFVRVAEHPGKFRRGSIKGHNPLISVANGIPKPLRTYSNLLESVEDIRYFEHNLFSRIVRVGINGIVKSISQPAMIVDFDISPSGRWLTILSVEAPFSNKVLFNRFAMRREMVDLNNGQTMTIATLPIADALTVSRDTVRPGPRMASWVGHRDSVQAVVEAEDGGDGRSQIEWRDRLSFVQFPEHTVIGQARFAGRVQGIFSFRHDQVLVREVWHTSRVIRNWLVDVDSGKKRLIHEYPEDSRELSPGIVLTRDLGLFRTAGSIDGWSDCFYFSGVDSSKNGEVPVLRKFSLPGYTTEIIWHSPRSGYTSPLFPPGDGGEMLVMNETHNNPPNLFLVKLGRSRRSRALTSYDSSWQTFSGIERRILRYRRGDGLQLSAMLYLPVQANAAGTRLPLLLWAYPRELTTKSAAAELRASSNRFLTGSGASPLTLAALGYAVLDETAMPILKNTATQANDSFIEQCVLNAQAAIRAAGTTGCIDMDRIAIGGRSYGAFMAMNLAAHTDLFRAAIAHNGAYNRTLTPFGFQYEERSLWEASETYFKVSPLLHADRIKTPVLLIHGAKDPNPGTHLTQSQRLFDALNGLGKIARLVVLPDEGHFYRSLEGCETVIHEMKAWLDRYL
jgi:dipeptidyl aminopeptidase/acylaminoacyl peptidase